MIYGIRPVVSATWWENAQDAIKNADCKMQNANCGTGPEGLTSGCWKLTFESAVRIRLL